MEQGNLTIYKASAGSGKTYCLTANYLTRIFRSKYAYRKILAVTFTNKAAGEMKEKILRQLLSLSRGEKTNMSETLQKSTGKSAEAIAAEAGTILFSILHDYSSFYVSTIDSFFQRILKSFTREIGLQQGYIIELDHSLILKNAVDNMLESAGEDELLLKWLIEYTRNRTEEGKSWNLRTDIIKLAGEIFNEKFRLLPEEERAKLKDREFLVNYVGSLRSLVASFEKSLSSYADGADELIRKHNVTDNMFLRGERGGIPSFIKIMKGRQSGMYKPLTATVRQVLDSPPVWSAKAGPPPPLQAALNDGLAKVLTDAVRHYENSITRINTAKVILENIYILGILADVLDQVHSITTTENRFLLSDAGELLYLIIGNDQTPFIYEKAGNAFANFMIDEFQDTSHIQWSNFRPLIMNSLSEGNDNLVVGDVKQSIYRWRNSDWSILNSRIQKETDPRYIKYENLETNWRSRKNIISFNNSLFSVLPGRIDELGEAGNSEKLIGKLYEQPAQNCPGNREDGYIRLEFIDSDPGTGFYDISLSRLPALVESLNEKGYYGSDIGFLVRKNEEGAAVMKTFLDYQASVDDERKKKYHYNIISSESLLLSASNVINLIIQVLSSIHTRDDKFSNALIIRLWLLCSSKDPDKPEDLPDGFEQLVAELGKLPLFSAVESVISFFRLGDFPGNVPYLDAFQDHVLEFSGSTSSDISLFLQWWETTGVKKSIILTENRDAMRVLTIHKAKGLEFRIVIIPFITWPVGHGRKNPVMWVNPATEPFNLLNLVPVKFKSDLKNTHFAEDYNNEEYFAGVDNLNLLYVAFTRAIDGLYGFCSGDPGSVSEVLLKTFTVPFTGRIDMPHTDLTCSFDTERKVFEYGLLPMRDKIPDTLSGVTEIARGDYFVNNGSSNFNLKLHGESWIVRGMNDRTNILNYGKVMHQAFENIFVLSDVESSVNKLIAEGKIPLEESELLTDRLIKAISDPVANQWFRPGLKVLNEAELLLPDGNTKRPDRVIVNGTNAVIIDFKFGEESAGNIRQVRQYRELLLSMGYVDCEAYLWYLGTNKIIKI